LDLMVEAIPFSIKKTNRITPNILMTLVLVKLLIQI